MVRWAAIEAISRNHGGDKIKADYRRIAERGLATSVASPRGLKVLRLAYYGRRTTAGTTARGARPGALTR